MTGQRVLLVEDDERIGSSLVRALTGTGYAVGWERTGSDALRVASRQTDLVILDLGLPDVEGLELCQVLHESLPDLPILMLTARAEETDVVIGLDAGAVDYVAKPFKLAELLARIRVQLRRAPASESAPAPTSARSATLTAGDVSVDVDARRAWCGSVELDLRPKEFDLLVRLLLDAGRAVRRETLMAEVWDEHWFGSTKTLDFHIASLRRKLSDPTVDGRITTLRGVGYRFELT